MGKLCCEDVQLAGPRRKEIFCLKVDRRRGKLGLDVDISSYEALPVVHVTEGPVEDWNEAHPEFAVLPGDWIIKVNDVEGDSEAMMERLRGDLDLKITVLRSHDQVTSHRHQTVFDAGRPVFVPHPRDSGRFFPATSRDMSEPCNVCLVQAPCAIPWMPQKTMGPATLVS